MPIRPSIILALHLTALAVTAHESPEHNVQHLSKHIQTHRTPDNLLQRAIAYRALNQLENARADLRSAITIAPERPHLHLELCRVQLALAQPTQALLSANHALQQSHTPSQRASAHILRAEAYQLNGQHQPSLQAVQLAFQEVPRGEIEWFLLRSENQRQLALHTQRIADLKSGHRRHHSAVLKAHWVDALIDASDYKTALPLIDSELSDRRWKSSWLIKRARTLQGLQRNTDAASALHAALAEIRPRLNSARPDPLLLADQGIAHALLGNLAGARCCLESLHHHRAPHWITSRLEEIIR
ncbi:MAG: tetratricopeptide repeat protein [Verrucomicrobiae bacterium]|nr:tetratricopeptide repeat protein [Verrucomicrobiae bacterium]NNJ44053.1 tetratricopeptide repeat protein [Akkermansiaceae bacterium]